MANTTAFSVKVFVDFWNITINARNLTSYNLELDWEKLAKNLANISTFNWQDTSTRHLAGCYIFGSYNPQNINERKFVESIQDTYGFRSGLFFDFQERIRKETSSKCDNCGESIHKASEVGVDVLLTVEMIKHASMKDHDYLVLASSDRDYLPLLSYLKDRGERVVHASADQGDRRMRSLTWKQVNIQDSLIAYSEIIHDDVIILTEPKHEHLSRSVSAMLGDKYGAITVINMSDKDQLSDKDFIYFVNRFDIPMIMEIKDGYYAKYDNYNIKKDLYKIRKALHEGKIQNCLPVVIRKGKVEMRRKKGIGPTYAWDVEFSCTIDELNSLRAKIA